VGCGVGQALLFLLETESLSGPVNVCAPARESSRRPLSFMAGRQR
jgi:NAD dependent epimerase/dehydratase family enzyme